MHNLLTIGHSTHSWEQFHALLTRHNVDAIADVRSSPFSARMPQFNREPLKILLRTAGIHYVFLGEELGARRAEPECYVEGVARYERIATTAAFVSGLTRIRNGLGRFRIALLCAEKDPLECHRTILVCRHLRGAAGIQHILPDGSLESQEESETRLMAEERVPDDDFFTEREKLLARAYDRRGNKIAYHECNDLSPRR
jgi:uncharacterized protein (DUF488 family)